MRKGLTILGRGPSWKDCPFQAPETWGTLSSLSVDVLKEKHFDKVFAFDSEGSFGGDIIECIALAHERGIPIVSTHSYATEPYPLVEVIKHFKTNFFRNTISYMLALALYLNYEQIRLDGIDAGPGWVYANGKTWITFWLGVATGKGVDYQLGVGSLKWAYRLGAQGIPQPFIDEEMEKLRVKITG